LKKILLALTVALSTIAIGQDNQTTIKLEPMPHTPVFHVTVTSRTVQAVNYQHRSGASKLDFAGTDLMPAATGQAKVESKKGYTEIEVEFANLAQPKSFGNEYLTYILWAVTPEGRAVNLGEIIVGDNHRSKVDVSTDLQTFALLVTAEPYYAVRQPSNVVVIENVVRADTKGTTQTVNAKYELMERGGYIPTGYKFDPVVLNAKLPLEFFEARNAMRIAESEGAATYAADTYQRATQLMNRADEYATRKETPKKELIATAREAVQVAEDSRAIAVTKMGEERLANERQASANAQANSQAQADEAMRQKQQAEADAARANSDAAQAKSDMDASAAAAARSKSEMDASAAASAAALAKSQADAEQARLAALQQTEADKAALREKLTTQLNTILQTRDSARGLIVNMSDVLFDTGKYTLKPGAREKLAKVAGILLSYPGLNIAVGGYTDSVGSDAMNQKLSENRAGSVRDYLVQQGVAGASVTASGMGNSAPVATNDNAAGRQQNRRVELVVSGEAIGKSASASTGTR
jgi:outer membrane protein OmpA-like peptidoglycan-associated protein